MTENPETLTPEQELNRISYFRALNRRRFLSGIGMASAGAAAAAVLGCGGSSKGSVGGVQPVMGGTPQPNDVLNFALNLEYLEASFYLYATTGTGLSSSLTSGGSGSAGGTISGGAQVTNFSPGIKAIAEQIAADEMQHVQILRTALTTNAVAMPNINLGALGTVNNQNLFLLIARAFEDTGVSAYLGGAQYLAGSTSTLQTAAQILAIEAYHAGNIRQNVIQLGLASQDKATDSQDVPTSSVDSASGANEYFCSNGALAIVRTPQQVLNIVYANTATGVTSGGFFPNGLNGTIIST